LRSSPSSWGANGAGKSNFLDALRFLVEGLETSIEFALRSRGGIEAVRAQHGASHNFGIQLEFLIGPHERARYGFEIAARRPRGFVVRRETLQVWNPATGDTRYHYDVVEGVVVSVQSGAVACGDGRPVVPPRSVQHAGVPACVRRATCNGLLQPES